MISHTHPAPTLMVDPLRHRPLTTKVLPGWGTRGHVVDVSFRVLVCAIRGGQVVAPPRDLTFVSARTRCYFARVFRLVETTVRPLGETG